MFDRFGAPFAVHVLQAAGSIMAGANPNEAISDGHVWAATAHLYLLVSFFILMALFRWMFARAKGWLAFGYLSIASLLIALGISDLANVDKHNRPAKAIFLFTFRSLQVDNQLQTAPILSSINDTLLTINLLMIIGHLEIYEICQPLITIKKCLSASSQQIISAQAIRYCRQIDSYWILLRQ
jgi:hypothetical protein